MTPHVKSKGAPRPNIPTDDSFVEFTPRVIRSLTRIALGAPAGEIVLSVFACLPAGREALSKAARSYAVAMVSRLRPDAARLAENAWAPYKRAVGLGLESEVRARGIGHLMNSPKFFAGVGKRGGAK
jgi:hypothetical protein